MQFYIERIITIYQQSQIIYFTYILNMLLYIKVEYSTLRLR